jgi:hypothetical protein
LKNRPAVLALFTAAAGAVLVYWLSRRAEPLLPPVPTSLSGAPWAQPDPCGGTGSLHLSFYFRDTESPWLRGKSYELELEVDGSRSECEFEVPVRMRNMNDMDDAIVTCSFTLTPLGEPAGLSMGGLPSNVSVRILSKGVVYYQGSVSPRYGKPEPPGSCIHDARVVLASVPPSP